MSEFGVKEKDARQAFLIFSHHLTVTVDFDYFIILFEVLKHQKQTILFQITEPGEGELKITYNSFL